MSTNITSKYPAVNEFIEKTRQAAEDYPHVKYTHDEFLGLGYFWYEYESDYREEIVAACAIGYCLLGATHPTTKEEVACYNGCYDSEKGFLGRAREEYPELTEFAMEIFNDGEHSLVADVVFGVNELNIAGESLVEILEWVAIGAQPLKDFGDVTVVRTTDEMRALTDYACLSDLRENGWAVDYCQPNSDDDNLLFVEGVSDEAD